MPALIERAKAIVVGDVVVIEKPTVVVLPAGFGGDDMSKVTELVSVKGAVFAVVDGGVEKFWIANGEAVGHVGWRWKDVSGTHNGTAPVIHEQANKPTMHGLGPVVNADVPSADHGGQTLIQLGWDQYGWRD
jgi:hypothetical protein